MWQYREKHHYIIQIRPVIEKWILKICIENKISLQNFNLPSELKGLLKVTKAVGSRKDERLIKIFKEMKNKNCKPVIELRRWLLFLKTNNYNTNLDLL